MKIKSADGLFGCLIYCADGCYRIRVYDDADPEQFVDYDIKHSDLRFEIVDDDVCLYEDAHGNHWIDYSPQTLGIK